jgi:hypothetical protein
MNASITPSARTKSTSEPVHVQPTLIKKKELAKRLSVSTRSIDGWVSKRVIPYIQITSRFYLFEFDAVLAALKKLYQVDARS